MLLQGTYYLSYPIGFNYMAPIPTQLGSQGHSSLPHTSQAITTRMQYKPTLPLSTGYYSCFYCYTSSGGSSTFPNNDLHKSTTRTSLSICKSDL